MTNDLIFNPEQKQVVGLFALLGALSGAIGFLLTGALDWMIERSGLWENSFNLLRFLPGAIYGLAVGLALNRLGFIGKFDYVKFVAICATSHL